MSGGDKEELMGEEAKIKHVAVEAAAKYDMLIDTTGADR